ncbi:unnamed protein product, partial [Pleuronectes platessa]
ITSEVRATIYGSQSGCWREKKRKRERRAGFFSNLKANMYRPALHSMFLSNFSCASADVIGFNPTTCRELSLANDLQTDDCIESSDSLMQTHNSVFRLNDPAAGQQLRR